MPANVPELIDRLNIALSNREDDPVLDQALTRWDGYSPSVWSDGQWRFGGLIAYFQSQLEILRAVDPSLPASLPPHCLDPVQIARLLGVPVEDFDYPGNVQLNRIERAVNSLLPSSVESHLSASPQQAVIHIERRGRKDWRIYFQKGNIKEEERFGHFLGFQVWNVLVKNPGRRFSDDPEELERLAQLPPPKHPRRLLVATGGSFDVDAASRAAVLTQNGNEQVGLVAVKEDDSADPRTVSELTNQIQRVKEELAITENPERRDELKQELDNLERWRGKILNRKGMARPLTAPSKETARSRVRNLLDRARNEIGTKMPHLARYLTITEEALEYDPSRAL